MWQIVTTLSIRVCRCAQQGASTLGGAAAAGTVPEYNITNLLVCFTVVSPKVQNSFRKVLGSPKVQFNFVVMASRLINKV